MEPRTFDNFDSFADDYRTIHTQNVQISGADSDYFSQYRVAEIYRQEQKLATETTKGAQFTLLDIGSGDGNAARFFTQFFEGVSFEGIDITEKVVKKAQSRGLERCRFQVYDGLHIPFENGHFDMVFLVGTLHHVDAQFHQQLMNEAYRVLKPGGRMYQFEHNPYNPVTQKLVKDCPFDVDAVLVPAGYVKKLEANAGFKKLRVRYTLFIPRFKVFKPFLFLENYLWWLPIGGQYYVYGVK